MSVKRKLPESTINEMLTGAIASGNALLSGPPGEDEVASLGSGYTTWDKRNELLIAQAFEKEGWLESGPKSEYASAFGLEYPFGLELADGLTAAGLRKDIQVKIARLKIIVENLDAYEGPDPRPKMANESAGPPTIFVVHGRSTAHRLEVENLIHQVADATPIVLSEQSNQGQTLIEKLEVHLSTTSFAVIIMTGDDEGRLRGSGSECAPRARQNVVLELGFAMAALGRSNVALLYEPGVEIPSDIVGVGYYELDAAGAWKTKIMGDWRAAGITVDANKIL